MHMLDEGGLVEGDNGYIGECPAHVNGLSSDPSLHRLCKSLEAASVNEIWRGCDLRLSQRQDRLGDLAGCLYHCDGSHQHGSSGIFLRLSSFEL